MTTVVQIMLPEQQSKWHIPPYPATSLAHMHAVQGRVLPTVLSATAELGFLALSALLGFASSLAASEGTSAFVSAPNGAVLVGWCPLACTAAGSELASVM